MTDKERKIGRPKKAPGEQRTEWLPRLRVTPAERGFVEDRAARAGLPVPEFCRRSIMGKRVAAAPAEAGSAAAVVALNRIGNNLNQIAARVNMTGDLADDFGAVLAELDAALRRVAVDE